MSFEGVVSNGAIVLDQRVALPDGTRVEVHVQEMPKTQSCGVQWPASAKELLLKLAGCMENLPSDMAAQHDHYIHGTPKR
jgi:hypothetical protein